MYQSPSNILVAIPSYNRPYKLDKTILRWTSTLDYHWKVFVEPKQYIYYKQSVGKDNLVKTNDDNGLAGQIVDIVEYAKTNGYKYIFKVDDDMSFVQKGKGIKRSGETANEIIPAMFEKIESDIMIGVITVCKPKDYMYSDGTPFKVSHKPVYGNYFAPVDLFNIKREHLLFDDLIITMDAILADKKILRCYMAYEQSQTHKNEGGLQTFDRDALSREAFKAIKKDYPLIEAVEPQDTKNNCFDVSIKAYL